MSWLLLNYFIPALNPSTPPKTHAPLLRPLLPILTQYKTMLKMTTRDASLRSQYKLEITQILREVERWVAEVKVAADISAATLEWDAAEVEGTEGEDSRELWALEKLCDALLDKGGLVPLSKK
jgi:ribosomal biogenesis protein LAS1